MFKNKCPGRLEAERMFPPEEDPVVMARKDAVAATAKAIANEAKITEDGATTEVKVKFNSLSDDLVGSLNKEMKFQRLVEGEEMAKLKT